MTGTDLLQLYLRLGLTPIPLKPCSKEPLVKWGNGWNPTPSELEAWASQPGINWGLRCGENLAVLDLDSEGAFRSFVATHSLPASCPTIKTGRGFHLWLKPKKPIRSQRINGVEVKCLGSFVVAPPSVHPSGTPYRFEIPPDGGLPGVDLEKLLGLGQIDSYTRLGQYASILHYKISLPRGNVSSLTRYPIFRETLRLTACVRAPDTGAGEK